MSGWFRHTSRVGAGIAAVVLLTACPGEDAARDLDDATAPELTLSVTAAAEAADGQATVDPGTTVELAPPGGSVFVRADDDDGVSWVEIWMTTRHDCGGTITGPGLAGAPTDRVEGAVTDTEAPSSLTVGVDINLLPQQPGCTYTYEVWGRAANAATTPVEVRSQVARLVLAVP